jgi:hypothetical protein
MSGGETKDGTAGHFLKFFRAHPPLSFAGSINHVAKRWIAPGGNTGSEWVMTAALRAATSRLASDQMGSAHYRSLTGTCVRLVHDLVYA